MPTSRKRVKTKTQKKRAREVAKAAGRHGRKRQGAPDDTLSAFASMLAGAVSLSSGRIRMQEVAKNDPEQEY